MFLETIVKNKRAELVHLKREQPLDRLKERMTKVPPLRDFKGALTTPPTAGNATTTRIIAEVKKASPSKGIIRENFNPVELASTFEENGAVALSVLTDKKYFQGNMDYLASIKHATTAIPLLDKDFIIDPYQIYQARMYGADAVLLIAAILSDELLADYLALSEQLGLSVLVEVHTLDELRRVLAMNTPIIGINNRNLTTFQVSTQTSRELLTYIPEGTLVVSESGIDSKKEIISLRERGVDAFLIGEALMREPDAGKKLRELIN
jgi:indole-3-glycerol phosphate synthase